MHEQLVDNNKEQLYEILMHHHTFLERFMINESDDIHILKSYVSILSFLALYYGLPKKVIHELVDTNMNIMHKSSQF